MPNDRDVTPFLTAAVLLEKVLACFSIENYVFQKDSELLNKFRSLDPQLYAIEFNPHRITHSLNNIPGLTNKKRNYKKLRQYYLLFKEIILHVSKFDRYPTDDSFLQCFIVLSHVFSKEEKQAILKGREKCLLTLLMRNPSYLRIPHRKKSLRENLSLYQKTNFPDKFPQPSELTSDNYKKYFFLIELADSMSLLKKKEIDSQALLEELRESRKSGISTNFVPFSSVPTPQHMKNLYLNGYLELYHDSSAKDYLCERCPSLKNKKEIIKDKLTDSEKNIFNFLKSNNRDNLELFFKDNINTLKEVLTEKYPLLESFPFLFKENIQSIFFIENLARLDSATASALKEPKEKDFLQKVFGFHSRKLSSLLKAIPQGFNPNEYFFVLLDIGKLLKLTGLDHNFLWKLFDIKPRLDDIQQWTYQDLKIVNEDTGDVCKKNQLEFLNIFSEGQKTNMILNSFKLENFQNVGDYIDGCYEFNSNHPAFFKKYLVESIPFNEINNIHKLCLIMQREDYKQSQALRSFEDIYLQTFEGSCPLKELTDAETNETYQLVLPKTNYELFNWGTLLRNCLGSYADKISETCIIVGLLKDGKLKGAIELRTNFHRKFNPEKYPDLKYNDFEELLTAHPLFLDYEEFRFYANAEVPKSLSKALDNLLDQDFEFYKIKKERWSKIISDRTLKEFCKAQESKSLPINIPSEIVVPPRAEQILNQAQVDETLLEMNVFQRFLRRVGRRQ